VTTAMVAIVTIDFGIHAQGDRGSALVRLMCN